MALTCRKSLLTVLLWLISCSVCNSTPVIQLKSDSIARDLDPELENAINQATPDFSKSLKRRFTNVGISEAILGREPAAPAIKLSDVFTHDGDNEIVLKNIIIQQHPKARLNYIHPNLFERNLNISADWYNIVLEGSYELINSSQLKILPVRSLGSIKIIIENVSTKGIVGFKTFNDALTTTNFDIQFNANNITIEIEYYNHENKESSKSVQNIKNIDKSIGKYIKHDLYWKLKESLRTRLDHVLVDFSLIEIFDDNLEISNKYISRNSYLDNFINQFVDQFLEDVQQILVKNKYDNISVPNIDTDFSHKFGFVTFWGTFHTNNGFLRDLTKIKRTGNFSVSSIEDSNKVQIFGSLGLEEFLLQYNYYAAKIWNIGPWGELKARVGKNSINFKLLAEVIPSLDSETGIKMVFSDYDIKVVQLDDIKVDCTGLSVVLNWLLSYIVTWITGTLKGDIVNLIEEKLRILLDDTLPKFKF